MSYVRRWATVLLLSLIAVFMVPGVVAGGVSAPVRLVALAGLVTAALGIRALLGSIVVVAPDGLTIQKNWPLRRRVPWYRILAVDVVPGFWNLEVELNSGERLVLPCVEHLDVLYEDMERHRHALDA